MTFDDKSRYSGVATYQVLDAQGRSVTVVAVPGAPEQTTLGTHLRKQGQRLDHLAAKYLRDPAGAWRLCELSDVMHPQALAEETEIPIPGSIR
jgi:hypothetical protein